MADRGYSVFVVRMEEDHEFGVLEKRVRNIVDVAQGYLEVE